LSKETAPGSMADNSLRIKPMWGEPQNKNRLGVAAYGYQCILFRFGMA
jgi:hypothetical protein